MNKRLVSYLRDNRDHIIENWLTESDLPPPVVNSDSEGSVPVVFLEEVFDHVLGRIGGREAVNLLAGESPRMHLQDILGVTCACQTERERGYVCVELHEAGVRAFGAVLSDNWDTQHEFTDFDREQSLRLINEALAWIFGQEIFRCPHRIGKDDCPFYLN
ncbi:hypothetical protein [Cerasicoccus maritimus]|uniref:hypothetical protein n=1 Tax=Cerasicoccus maritimus TaxID=490089 RepID=UPI002852A013|nr:hypothetical protein [Cerasicoccus maritimus]